MSRAAEVIARISAGQPAATTADSSPEAAPPTAGDAPPPASPDATAAASGDESTAAEPKAETPKPADPLAPKFAALSRREQLVIRREREAKDALAQDRARMEQERAQWQNERAELEAYRSAKGNPKGLFAVLEKSGITPQQLAEYLASDGSAESATARKVAELEAKLAKRETDEEQRAREMEKRRITETKVGAERAFLNVAAVAEKFPTANALWTPGEILSVAHEELRLARAEGIDISRVTDEQVAQAVEMRAKQRAQRLAGLQSNTREHAPPGATPVTTDGSGHPASKAGANRTLTNELASAGSGPKETDMPREARVARLVKQLQRTG